jgi:hypothetical protein
MTTAEAPPPPLHMAAAPILALFCSKTFNNVIMIRPEQPNGCPSETVRHLHLLYHYLILIF